MKLRKLKKGHPKGSRQDAASEHSTGVPVMAFRVAGVPVGAIATADRPDVADPIDPGAPEDDDDAVADALAADAEAEAAAQAAAAAAAEAEAELQERIEAAETMYRAAHARVAAAEALEQAAAERLADALQAERAAVERLADAEARERAADHRLAAADGFEQALAARLAATDSRERAAAERDAIANQRDRTAAERDAISNERDRAATDRAARIDAILGGRLPELTAGAADGIDDHSLEVARLEAELQRAHLDALTGALRREMGRLTLRNEIERARRGDGRFVVAYIDIDGLKAVNDQDGHAAGDRILRTLSATLRAHLRSYDPIVRYGGDEFVCGISSIDPDEVEHRLAIIDQSMRRATGVGISAGIARLTDSETLDDLTARADAALLEAKRSRGE